MSFASDGRMLEHGFSCGHEKSRMWLQKTFVDGLKNQALCLSEQKGSNHDDDALGRTILRQLNPKLRETLCFHYPD